MPVLPLDCHLPTQYTTHTITLQQWTNNKTNKSYKQLLYIHISCKCDTNRAGHFTLDAHASRPVACILMSLHSSMGVSCLIFPFSSMCMCVPVWCILLFSSMWESCHLAPTQRYGIYRQRGRNVTTSLTSSQPPCRARRKSTSLRSDWVFSKQ